MKVIFREEIEVSLVNWQAILLDNLITIREPFPAHHSEWIINRIKAYGQDMKSEVSQTTASRLYIKRGKTKNGRNIENEEEIIEYLKGKGYCIVKMDGLSVEEQIRYFENASEIIGAHGAAFTNMVYCKPKTKIIELYHPEYLPGQNIALAQLCKLNLITLIGKKINFKKRQSSLFNPNQYT